MGFNPGERLEARCTRCKDILGHIIVSMLGDEIAKVECCACGSVHKYYPPAKKKEPKKETTLRVRAGEERNVAVKEKVAKTSYASSATEGKTSTKKAPSAAKISKAAKTLQDLQAAWKKAIETNALTPVPYSMHLEATVDMLVDHSVFGLGVVVETFPPDKAEFLFAEGFKSLRCKIS